MTTQDLPSPAAPKLVAGVLCLDFANTADWHASSRPQETLTSYAALVAWAARAGALDAAVATCLVQDAAKRPGLANAVLRHSIAVRDAIYRIALGFVERRPPVPADLETFNQALAAALRHRRLVPGRQGLEWTWQADDRALDRMLWPVLWSAADLFTSAKRERIGQCADDRGCGWLFLDTTRNHSRRWCDMEDCGNRAKALRHYRRSRPRPVHRTQEPR